MTPKRPLRSDRLLAALEPFDPVLVVTHDNPDPDAIAAGWAIHTLVRERLAKKVRLVGGGDIVRAENAHLVRLLEPPIELIQQADCPPGAGIVLVDCHAGGQNHVFCRSGAPLVAVIDHHDIPRRRGPKTPFHDRRPNVAASASIAASYLREQRIEPGSRLATALWYALRTETRGGDARYSRLDRTVLLWMIERANPTHLAEIENAPLHREYFGDLILALQGTFLYDDAALCLLPRAANAEIVGEVADLLIRCVGIRRVFCGAMVEDDLFVSVRTEPDAGDAASLVQCVLAGLGHGGGHAHRAGGKIPGAGSGVKIHEDLQEDLRNRWLEACRVDRQRGTRLVARREIVENL